MQTWNDIVHVKVCSQRDVRYSSTDIQHFNTEDTLYFFVCIDVSRRDHGRFDILRTLDTQ
jgi:hypothetical protein